MITDQMKIAVKKVHNLIFKLFLRISSSAESKVSFFLLKSIITFTQYFVFQTNFITPETFGAIIYDNYLFDIPKMIDLSVLYANTDYQPLLMRMFSNVIQCQPRYLEDMNKGCANFVEALNLIEEKLGLNENQFGNNSKLKYLQFPELQNIISNLTDISVSLRVLLISMPQFANNYKTASIERIIIEFYNKVFPPLQKELNYRFESIENSDL
jgi:activating signal cointegrator complex subunit 2